jgi:hypothetical protein
MGNASYIVDIRGFEIEGSEDKPELFDFIQALYYAFNMGSMEGVKKEIEFRNKEDEKKIIGVFEMIEKLDSDIEGHIADQCLGEGSLAIGWRWDTPQPEKATPKKLEALKTILENVGFTVQSLEKDRFLTYG